MSCYVLALDNASENVNNHNEKVRHRKLEDDDAILDVNIKLVSLLIERASLQGLCEINKCLPEYALNVKMQTAILIPFKDAGYTVHIDAYGGVIKWENN